VASTPEGTCIAQTPTTASANGFGTKFDLKLNANNSIAARYIFGDSLQSGPPFAGLPAGQGNPPDMFNSIAPSRAQMAGVSWTSNMGTNKILESRLRFTRFTQIMELKNKIERKTL